MELKIEYLPTTDLIPYARNSRTHTDEQVAQVAASIREFGFASPVLIAEDKTIIAGHCRVMAAQKLGLETVPTVTATGWTEAQKRAYVIVDNRLAENAGWDVDMLKTEFADLDDLGFDLSLLGFDESEIGDLLADDETTEPLTDPDEIPEPEETPVTRTGDIWTLGNHRLMCGDSTNGADVALLMDGERADIAFTSPPYGASASARLRKHYKPGEKSLESFYIEHGDKSCEWADLIRGALANMETHSVAQFVNIQMLADNKPALLEIVAERAARLGDVLVWDKQKAPPQMQSAVLNNEFEFIFLFTEKGSRSVPFADWHGTESNIVRIKPGANEFSEIHKAVFPVALPDKILSLASGARSVLDPFCGTGTTIIAAQMKGIRAFGLEIDPHYCDVIIQRWQNLTGKQATMNGKTYDQLREERNGAESA